MVKKELAVIVTHRCQLPAEQVEAVLNDAIHIIQTALGDGEKVFLLALKVPHFTYSRSFKAVVNKN